MQRYLITPSFSRHALELFLWLENPADGRCVALLRESNDRCQRPSEQKSRRDKCYWYKREISARRHWFGSPLPSALSPAYQPGDDASEP